MCRYQGGPNAGHTIVVDGETWKLRQMPSGVVSGTTSVIGAGCVVDPQVFLDEVDLLKERGIDPSIVVLSGNAHLIMPWHVTIDQASERRLGNLQIGTTRRGIGPAYADKASRIGIRVQDVLDPKILRQKIEVALAEKNLWLERIYEVEPFDLEEVWAQYAGFAERLAPFVGDVSLLVDQALDDGKDVLFEGAQATMLDLDHGTYPFVTSSNPIASGAPTGIGIGPTRIDRVLGISKAYVTRVGEGPFPSEIVGPDQERLRELGGEFGTVTGRDAPLRLARPGRAALRRARERDHVARADEARRALGVRRAAGVRPLPACATARRPSTSRRTSRTSTTPSRCGRCCPAGSSRSTTRRTVDELPAAARDVRRVRLARSSTCRSSSSASARRANACFAVIVAYTASTWTQVIVALSIFVPVHRALRACVGLPARRAQRPGRAALPATRRRPPSPNALRPPPRRAP